jgi:hypothetical protein
LVYFPDKAPKILLLLNSKLTYNISKLSN